MDSKAIQNLNPLIVELILAGGVFTIYADNKSNIVIDLNTGMKSECVVTQISKNVLKCEMRYNVVKKVNTIKTTARQFCQMICDECMHGETYLRESWSNIFKHHNIKVPDGI